MSKQTEAMKARAKKFSAQLELMENRKKGDLQNLISETVTIIDYGFLKDEKGSDYIVFITNEDKENFYFGGMVLTQNVKELDAEFFGDTIRKEGLPCKFGEKRSKNKMVYTTCEFYPEG